MPHTRSRFDRSSLQRLMAAMRNVQVPLLVRSADIELEFVRADAALDVAPEDVATIFAAPLPVKDTRFAAVMERIRLRDRHLTSRIFPVCPKVFSIRSMSTYMLYFRSAYVCDRRWID